MMGEALTAPAAPTVLVVDDEKNIRLAIDDPFLENAPGGCGVMRQDGLYAGIAQRELPDTVVAGSEASSAPSALREFRDRPSASSWCAC